MEWVIAVWNGINWPTFAALFIFFVPVTVGLFKLIAAEYRRALQDAQNTSEALSENLDKLQKQYDELQKQNTASDPRNNLAFRDGMYWEPGSIRAQFVGHEQNYGPYCPRCLEMDGLKVSLQKQEYFWACINNSCEFNKQHTDTLEPPENY